jgi:hypothetical protein
VNLAEKPVGVLYGVLAVVLLDTADGVLQQDGAVIPESRRAGGMEDTDVRQRAANDEVVYVVALQPSLQFRLVERVVGVFHDDEVVVFGVEFRDEFGVPRVLDDVFAPAVELVVVVVALELFGRVDVSGEDDRGAGFAGSLDHLGTRLDCRLAVRRVQRAVWVAEPVLHVHDDDGGAVWIQLHIGDFGQKAQNRYSGGGCGGVDVSSSAGFRQSRTTAVAFCLRRPSVRAMNRRPMAAIALALLLALAGCSAGYQPSSAEPATAEPPESDNLGYYDGYWHNETLDINASNGLTEPEMEAVLSRAMARVQLLRGLEFEEDIEVELQTRAEFREESDDVWTEPGEGAQQLGNAQFEALFLVGPDEDVVDVRSGNRGDNVLGFYQPGTGRLVLVSEQDPATLANEYTLAHELVHAMQDQQFGLESLGPATLDSVNARNGLIEGEAMSVQHDYEDRCESGEWQCVGTGGGSGASVGSEFHWGVYFAGFFPYAEGPSFIAYHRERGGWDAIDAMHGEQPTDAAEVIYPATYDTDAYGNATVTDRNDADWERVRTDDGPDYAEVGQSGLASMFAYTVYADSASTGVIDRSEFINSGDSGLDRQRPFTYNVSYAEGWYADRLHAYADDNRTAFVWNVTFNDRANATEFGDGYEQVFEFWGGQRVATRGNAEVWRFGEDEEFRGAVWVRRDGTSFTVVKAPDRAELDDVYAPAGTAEAGG